jgi:hypothetical protein
MPTVVAILVEAMDSKNENWFCEVFSKGIIDVIVDVLFT